MAEQIPIETLAYRLDSIEKQLADMKGLLTEQALTSQEINGIKADIQMLESRVNNLYKQVGEMKHDSSSKYKQIVDYTVKFFFTAFLGYICVKLGVKQ